MTLPGRKDKWGDKIHCEFTNFSTKIIKDMIPTHQEGKTHLPFGR